MRIQIFSDHKKDHLLGNFQHIDIATINNDLVPNSSINQIMLDQALSYVSEEEAMKCLSFCYEKLRINGTITIKDLDIDALTRSTFDKTITSQEFNDLIHNRTYIHSLHTIKRLLMQHLTIETLEIKNTWYSMQCTKQ